MKHRIGIRLALAELLAIGMAKRAFGLVHAQDVRKQVLFVRVLEALRCAGVAEEVYVTSSIARAPGSGHCLSHRRLEHVSLFLEGGAFNRQAYGNFLAICMRVADGSG